MSNIEPKSQFLRESLSNLSSINEDLHIVAKNPEDLELINKIYRAIHTMKGSAGFLGYTDLQDLAHSAENILDELRAKQIHMSPDVLSGLLDTFDTFFKILKSIESEDKEISIDVYVLKSQLDSLLTTKVPIRNILAHFEKSVEGIARRSNKRIILKLLGQEIELHKEIIQTIKDPLLHIIQNSCVHGIETVDERKASGKEIYGTILVNVSLNEDKVMIEVKDDGRGLNIKEIKARAIEKGFIDTDKSVKLIDTQVFELIFTSGVSTAKRVTNISGRGVGMDIVKTNIESIGGTIQLFSEEGRGMTILLSVPLSKKKGAI
jgi:two-component system chemotaxis sensor kinase CheA